MRSFNDSSTLGHVLDEQSVMDGNVLPCSQLRIDASTKIAWPDDCVFVGLIQAYYLVDYCLHIQSICLHEGNFGL